MWVTSSTRISNWPQGRVSASIPSGYGRDGPASRSHGYDAAMAVTVFLPTLLRTHADGASTVSDDGATVGQVFDRPDRPLPGLRRESRRRRRQAPQVRERVPQRRRHPVPRAPRHAGLRRRRDRDSPGGGRRATRPSSTLLKHESILGLIGNTPLVGIHTLSPNPDVKIYAKLEGQNPGGSSKDRIALKMVELAEAGRRAPTG